MGLNLNSSQPGKGLEVAPAAAMPAAAMPPAAMAAAAVVAAVAVVAALAAVAAAVAVVAALEAGAVAVAAVAAEAVAAVDVVSTDFGKARGIADPGRTEDMVVILRGGTGGRLALSTLWGIPDTVTGALTAIIWIRMRPASSAQVAN